jgi:hypothetical protein
MHLSQAQGGQGSQAAQARSAEITAAQAAQLAREVEQVIQAQIPQPPQAPQIYRIEPGGGVGRIGSPAAVYEALREQRSELRNQLERLEEQRENLSDDLRSPNVSGTDQKGVETRIANIDARISDVESQLAASDAAVARAAAIPGAVQPPPPPPRREGPPEEVFVLAGIFLFIVVLPLTIAYARRIWRRGAAAVSAIPQEIYDRFNRLDQAIDSVAIEVERIGEGQRFLTRVYADQQRGIGGGPAERIESPDRERVGERHPLK